MILKSTTFSLLGDASFLRDKQCGQMRSRLDSNHLKLSTFQLETVNESTFHDPPGMFELLLVKLIAIALLFASLNFNFSDINRVSSNFDDCLSASLDDIKL